MKIRHFLTSILAGIALVGCVQEELPALSEIQVTPSYFTFGVDGGSKEVAVTAVGAWDVTDIPDWLTVSPTSGKGAGKVTITAAATTEEAVKSAILKFNCSGKSQNVTVGQDAFVPDYPKFAAGDYWIVFDGGAATPINSAYGYLYTAKCNVSEDGKYSSTAANIFTFTAVEGGFTIQDPAGQYYCMQGTYDSFNVYKDLPATGGVWSVTQTGETTFKIANNANGKVMQYDPNYSSAGAYANERGIYPYLVSVSEGAVSEVMFEVEPVEVDLTKEAGEFTIEMTCRNDEFEIVPSAEWITLTSVSSEGPEYKVNFSYDENDGPARSATIDFTSNGETFTVEVSQEGSIVDATVAEFLAAEVGPALFKLTGKVTNLKPGDYGNFHLVDATGSVYVYGLTATPVEKNDKSFPSLGIREGDIVTLIGTRARYDNAKVENEKEQVGGPAYYVSHVSSTDVTVAEFLAKETSKENRYRLTGTIEEIVSDTYGNFYLSDESGRVYVYGLTVAPVAKNDKSFATLGLKVGDKVTIVGTRDHYAGAKVEDQKDQVGGPAYYISHEAAAEE